MGHAADRIDPFVRLRVFVSQAWATFECNDDQHSPEYDSSEEEEEEELVYTSGSEDGSEEIEGDGHNQSRDRSAANSSFDADLYRLSSSMSLNDNGRDRRAPASAAGASVAPTATSPMASNPYRMHPASPRVERATLPSTQSPGHGPSIHIITEAVSSPHRAKKVVSSQPVEISDSETESDIDTGFEETEAEEEDDEDDERDIPSSMSSDVRASTRRTIPPARNTCTDASDTTASAQAKTSALGRASTLPALGSSRASVPQGSQGTSAAANSYLLNRSQSDGHPASQPVTSSRDDQSAPTGQPLGLSGDGYAVISHDSRAQELMDRLKISWGVQYELARGVSKGMWTWSEVTREKLKNLQDVKIKVPPASCVFDVMLGREVAARRLDVWRELEREQLALVENETRGLGLMGKWQESAQQNWYGGKIQQIVRLVPHKATPKGTLPTFYMQLEPMQMGRSYRFARFLGSRRLLQMKLPKLWDVNTDELKMLVSQKFVLCGRVFVAFAVKDGKLYCLETIEDYGRAPSQEMGDQLRMPLEAFVDWYNPMRLNGGQKINKWTARFDLGLSTSIPVLQFDPANISIIEDLCAPHDGGSVPSNKIYTDGCGYMNTTAFISISRALGFTERPTAVQGRILGSKGVWTLHPRHTSLDEPPMIWIRKSQQKIHLVNPKTFNAKTMGNLHRAHFIFAQYRVLQRRKPRLKPVHDALTD